MAHRDPERFNAYLRKRYQRRKAEALKQLGGKCAWCGATADLQVDHVRRAEKTMPFSRMYVVSQQRFEEELSRCQLLCRACHQKKSIEEVGFNSREVCGTYASYRYRKCRCAACRAANREHNLPYKKRVASSNGSSS